MAYMARAVTNSIGCTISNSDVLSGDLTCKTDSFKIPTEDVGMFCGDSQSSFSLLSKNRLGVLIGAKNNKINIIASRIFEN